MPSRRQSRQTGPLYLANSITSSYTSSRDPLRAFVRCGLRSADLLPAYSLTSTPVPGGKTQTLRFLGGRQPLCGIGVTSLIARTSMPAVAKARTAHSRPDPGPATRTSTVRSPDSLALLAAVRDAC